MRRLAVAAAAVAALLAVDHARLKVLDWLADLDAFRFDLNAVAVWGVIDSATAGVARVERRLDVIEDLFTRFGNVPLFLVGDDGKARFTFEEFLAEVDAHVERELERRKASR